MTGRRLLLVLAVMTLAGPAPSAVIRPDAPGDQPLISWRLPVVAAPLMPEAPTIDGTVHRAEWSAAARLAPFVAMDTALATEEPNVGWIGHTAEALHVAWRFSRPPYAPPPMSGTDPLGVWRDDCMEMFLRPPGERGALNFVGNAAGVHEEGYRTSATDKRWSVEWTYAARVTETGWEGELAIPFASLEREAPEPGEVWGFTIANNQRSPRGMQATWSWLREWKADRDFGFLTFAGDPLAARVLQAGEISRSEVGALLEVSNFGDGPAAARVTVSLHRPTEPDISWFRGYDSAADPLADAGDAERDLPAEEVLPRALEGWEQVAREEHEVLVPARQSRRVVLAQQAPRGGYLLHYEVTDAATGAILAAGPLAFERRAPLEVVLTPYVLSAGAVEVTADYRRVPGISESDELTVALLPAEGEPPIAMERRSVDVANGRTILDLDVSDVPAGDYLVGCALVPPEGAPRAERTEDLHVPEPPEWWDHPVGHPEATDTVPPPWTPMRVLKDGFAVWNREIGLGDALQPASITAGGSEMLAGPVRLHLSADGLTVGESEVTLHRKTGMSWEAPLSADALSGELVLSAEFDGFMKYTLSLRPEGDGARLDRLVLEIPLSPELAQYYNHGSLGTPPGHGLVEVRNEAGEVAGDGLAIPFSFSVWVGDAERGINWVAEDDQWWRPADAERAIVIDRSDAGATLRINFVEEPLAIDEPVTFEWALLPTPSKPMNERYLHDLYLVQRAFFLNEEMTGLADNTGEYIDALVDAGANAMIHWSWAGKSLWNDDFSAPAYRPTELNQVKRRAFKQAIDMAHQAGIDHVIVYALWAVITDWPGLQHFWQEMPLHPLLPTPGGYKQCSAKPFADWHVWTLAQTVRELGIDGVYLDGGANPRICTNMHHGHGYIDEDGNPHGSYGVFAKREHLKRIYTLFHGELVDDGLVYVHHSGTFLPAIESFADIHHGGEGTDFVMDDFIGKFYGRPFGLPVTFTRWNVAWYPERRINSWRLALLADATIKATPQMIASKTSAWEEGRRENYNDGYDLSSQPVWWIWQAHKRFPFEGSQWLPYWEIEPYVRIAGDAGDLYAAMHLNPGRAALLTVSSFRDEPTQVELRVDWRRMGFEPGAVTVTDAITEETVPVTAEGLTLEVLEQRFRLLEIRPAE